MLSQAAGGRMNSKIQTIFGSELVPKNRVASTIDLKAKTSMAAGKKAKN